MKAPHALTSPNYSAPSAVSTASALGQRARARVAALSIFLASSTAFAGASLVEESHACAAGDPCNCKTIVKPKEQAKCFAQAGCAPGATPPPPADKVCDPKTEDKVGKDCLPKVKCDPATQDQFGRKCLPKCDTAAGQKRGVDLKCYTPDPVDAGGPAPVDAGAPAPVDAGAPAPVDAGAPAPVDAGAPAPAACPSGQEPLENGHCADECGDDEERGEDDVCGPNCETKLSFWKKLAALGGAGTLIFGFLALRRKRKKDGKGKQGEVEVKEEKEEEIEAKAEEAEGKEGGVQETESPKIVVQTKKAGSPSSRAVTVVSGKDKKAPKEAKPAPKAEDDEDDAKDLWSGKDGK